MSSTMCCIFCEDSSNNVLYEINGNSILIEKDLIDIDDLIFDLFMSRTDPSTTSYICEDCKEQLVQFYLFKSNAKKCLPQSSFDLLFQQFIDFTSMHKNENLNIKCTDDELLIHIEETEVNEYDEVMFMECDEDNVEEENLFDTQFLQIPASDEMKQEVKNNSLTNEFEIQVVGEDVLLSDEDKKLFVTCQCGETFTDMKELKLHSSAVHKKKEVTTREYPSCCGVMFKEPKYLKMHENAHESFNAVLSYLPWFNCEECKIHFSNDKDLETHNKLHESEALTDKFELIPRPSAFEDHFLKNKNLSSNNSEILPEGCSFGICGHCGKKKSLDDIKLHLLFFHTTTIECPLENRIFEGNKQIRLFVIHLKNKHPEIFDKGVEYTCTYCNANFPTTFERLAHMKICDNKKYICVSHCGKRFKSEWLLNKHIQTIQGGDDRFKCNLCGKVCLSKSDLQIHMRSHTNERPYVCTICDKAFKTSANRSSHMDVHREEKIHECNVCFEKFQTRPILRKHKKKHDLEYQSQCICKVCEKSYISRTHLLRHIKTTHLRPDLTIEQIDSFFEECSDEKIKQK